MGRAGSRSWDGVRATTPLTPSSRHRDVGAQSGLRYPRKCMAQNGLIILIDQNNSIDCLYAGAACAL